MDELEWLSSNPPPQQPSADTTAQHRTALQAAIATERDSQAVRKVHPVRAHPRRRAYVTALAVAAACVIGALVVALGTRDNPPTSDRVFAPAAQTPNSTALAGTPACGTTLP